MTLKSSSTFPNANLLMGLPMIIYLLIVFSFLKHTIKYKFGIVSGLCKHTYPITVSVYMSPPKKQLAQFFSTFSEHAMVISTELDKYSLGCKV